MKTKEVFILSILNKPVATSDFLLTLFTDEVFSAAFVNATGDLFVFDGSMSVKGAYSQASRILKTKSEFVSFTNGGTRPFNYSISKAYHYEKERQQKA